MTVADYGSSSLGAYLDDTLFSNETRSIQLQVKWLWYLESQRKLYLAFRAPISGTGDWELHIDDQALDFPSGDSNFVFRNVDVSWTEGQIVKVKIVRRELRHRGPALFRELMYDLCSNYNSRISGSCVLR